MPLSSAYDRQPRRDRRTRAAPPSVIDAAIADMKESNSASFLTIGTGRTSRADLL